jgi:amino acid transporter
MAIGGYFIGGYWWLLVVINVIILVVIGDYSIVVTYEIRVFFKGAQKQVFSSILKFENVNT